MRVEFVGLPASGKSWACGVAHAVLEERGIAVGVDRAQQWRTDRRQLLADYLEGAARRRQGVTVTAGAAWLLQHAARRRSIDVLRAWGACAYLVAVDAHIRGLEPAPAWLQDQGAVQALWSVAMRSGAAVSDVSAGFESRISWPDLVVEVRAPLTTVVERLQRRPATPTSLGSAQNLAAALARGQDVLSTLRARATARSVPWLVATHPSDVGGDVADHVQGALR